ncbi:3-coathanger stack domain-containing protein [Flavobacterium sp. 1355]|uniref:RHS repeat domain-containing protein n=1 Tax=Flavobacterium sp. 1355 TaxID=2806571 RepID=UPI001B67C0F6|nr:3-coathanger stack domain-containing protein [Flavobacterium sp. 1355]MBP1221755.1 RHS repeat-associated protein [Flavobacterium sp. 1355]
MIPPKAVDLLGTTSAQADLTSTVQLTSASAALHLTASNSIRLLPGFHAQAGSTFSAVIDDNKTVLDNLCYQYKYDYRNRLVEKKLPGKQWEFIVYDKLDRVVATGPANSPFSDITTPGWSITKYDAFNRPVITGWLPATVTAAARKTLQDAQNALTANFNETKIATATNTIIPATTGVKFRYDNAAWPTTGYHIMSVNYYDDYNFPDAPTIPATVAANTAGVSQAVYYNATTKPIGLATGSWVRVPDLSTNYKYEQSYSLYDAKARPVRSYTQNFLGGFTCTDSKLDAFSGQLQYTITTHSRLATDPALKTTETYTYSAQDRLISQTHQTGTATAETLFTNTYDELGQLVSKKVGGSTQKIDYTYNIRGWLTGINDVDALAKTGDPKDLFAFKVNYNTTTTAGVKALYNGNIAETYWSSASEATPVVRGYGYVYDNLNRLRTGIFKQAGTVNNFYDEILTYDKNGNIMSLMRNGNPTALQQIDKLAYSYGTANITNQLTKVVDNATTYKAGGFVDSAANTADDYSYDANGNMTRDNNKNITAITYNHLNLPAKITFGTTGNIVYLYNAAGQKVRKVVSETGKSDITTDYLGGYQYDNSALKFFPTAEGYVEASGSSYKYIYQYKDHLGNIRLSYDKTLAIKEESNFYPFGMKQEGYNNIKIGFENKYKYQGQERQDELGLNWDSFKWRNYDMAIGRFMNIDPLSEKYAYQSHYNFSENRVIDGRELEGLEVVLLKDSAHNKPVLKAANSGQYKDNPETKTIHVFAHGNPKEFYNDFGAKGETTINSGAGLNKVLNQSSELWKNSESKEGFTIVLHACRTGKYTMDKNGKVVEPVADKISASKEMEGVTIVAPDQRDGFSADGKEIGPQATKNTDFNGDYLPGTKKEEQGRQTSTYGFWNTFVSGTLTQQTNGNQKPSGSN